MACVGAGGGAGTYSTALGSGGGSGGGGEQGDTCIHPKQTATTNLTVHKILVLTASTCAKLGLHDYTHVAAVNLDTKTYMLPSMAPLTVGC